MAENSKIEWTEHTFNMIWGCTKVSEGCQNCYAESFSKRVGLKVWGQDVDRRFFGENHWQQPFKWNKAAERLGVMHRVFCGSMCDVLEDREELEPLRRRVFDIAVSTPNLLWLFLTKRPENAVRMFPAYWDKDWPRNAMFGVTLENQRRLDERMPHIIQFQRVFPGSLIFASCEPLLSELDWTPQPYRDTHVINYNSWLPYFDWVIGGGESGPRARPCQVDWARKLRDDCRNRADMGRPWPLPFLWKQWGQFAPISGAAYHIAAPMVRFADKKKAGRTLDARTWDDVPVLPYGPQLPGVPNYGATA